MMAPYQLVASNPRRPRESDQGYAIRLLNVALQHWTGRIYDQARAIAEKEADRCPKEAQNTVSNILIAITQAKLTQIECLHLGQHPGGTPTDGGKPL